MRKRCPRSQLQILLDLSHNLANLEWPTFDLGKGNRIDQISRANHRAQLAEIHLRYDHGFESGKNFTKVLWEGIQVTQMRRRYWFAFIAQLFHRRSDRSIGCTPAQHHTLPGFITDA